MKSSCTRLYKFVSDEWIEDILLNRHLKISFADNVNDIYELRPFDFGKRYEGAELEKR